MHRDTPDNTGKTPDQEPKRLNNKLIACLETLRAGCLALAAGAQAERVTAGREPGVDLLQPDPRRRSDGHSAGLPSAAISGRTSLTHWSRISRAQTVSTLRRLGGDPFFALP
jgi:hypothetical protein